MFVHHADHEVVDVQVVLDTLDECRDGENTCRIIKELGVIVILEGGATAITQEDVHDEMLVALVEDVLDKLTVPPVGSQWEDKRGIEYTRSRASVSVEDLLGM